MLNRDDYADDLCIQFPPNLYYYHQVQRVSLIVFNRDGRKIFRDLLITNITSKLQFILRCIGLHRWTKSGDLSRPTQSGAQLGKLVDM
jgi:hypothetical protein